MGRNRRRRSRSKDREEREKERAEREKERERKRKGLPVVKKDFLSGMLLVPKTRILDNDYIIAKNNKKLVRNLAKENYRCFFFRIVIIFLAKQYPKMSHPYNFLG